MKKPHVYELNLKALKEPDDLWNRLFFDWLKSISEQHAMTTDRLNALERAIAQLDKAVGELVPEKPQELSNAMSAIEELQGVWKQQLARSVESTEKIAVTAKRIVASQKS